MGTSSGLLSQNCPMDIHSGLISILLYGVVVWRIATKRQSITNIKMAFVSISGALRTTGQITSNSFTFRQFTKKVQFFLRYAFLRRH